ncbi:MAG: sigma-70 family RNA polymerase sigma factor [Armatimonadetes bacterium]|nr:sigma-70 family RNA polymerase sigma factor [Armatimonadota bacterium]
MARTAPEMSMVPYTDAELVALVSSVDRREKAQRELLRRHSSLLASQVLRAASRSISGAEMGDYESLAVIAALQSYDSFQPGLGATPVTYVYRQVRHRLEDAQRRTSLESDRRWPERKVKFREWLRGDYDKYPEFRERFEYENGLTFEDRADMTLQYAHLLADVSDHASQPFSCVSDDSYKHGGYNHEKVVVDSIVLSDALCSVTDDLDRRVLCMFAFDDLSLEEIASSLEIEIGDARRRLRRARDHVRDKVATA